MKKLLACAIGGALFGLVGCGVGPGTSSVSGTSTTGTGGSSGGTSTGDTGGTSSSSGSSTSTGGAPSCPDDPANGPVDESCGIWLSASLGDDKNPGTQ